MYRPLTSGEPDNQGSYDWKVPSDDVWSSCSSGCAGGTVHWAILKSELFWLLFWRKKNCHAFFRVMARNADAGSLLSEIRWRKSSWRPVVQRKQTRLGAAMQHTTLRSGVRLAYFRLFFVNVFRGWGRISRNIKVSTTNHFDKMILTVSQPRRAVCLQWNFGRMFHPDQK